MIEFKKELAELLKKHNVALVCRSKDNARDLSVEVGFQDNYCDVDWIGRHHVTDYDLTA